jgi:hypothetical protein
VSLSVGLGKGTDLQLVVATLASQRLVSFLAHDLAEEASEI